MTLHERYPDIVADQPDPQTLRLLKELDALYTVPTPPDSVRLSFTTLLAEQGQAQQHRHTHRWRPRHPRLTLVLATLLISVVGSMLDSMRLHTPIPVSAQILIEKAATQPGVLPNRVVHQVWITSSYDTGTGRPRLVTREAVDLWTQVNSQSVAIREAAVTSDPAGLLWHSLRLGGRVALQTQQQYNARTNTLVTIDTSAPASCPPGTKVSPQVFRVPMLVSPSLLRGVAQRGQTVRLLSPQVLAGTPVEVVEIARDRNFTTRREQAMPYNYKIILYIDPRTYLIHGSDQLHIARHGTWTVGFSMRLARYEVRVPSTVPAGIFQLHVPSSARHVHYSDRSPSLCQRP